MPTLEQIAKAIQSAGLDAASRDGAEILNGGKADGMPTEAFDPEQLAKGIAVEMEHTDDRAVAEEIAKDHLAEDPAYYQKLEQMEQEGGVDKATFSRFAALARKRG